MKTITRFFLRIIRIITSLPLIKSLISLFTVLMSYRIIKFIWYFNKLIIYLCGLVSVGFSWPDFTVLTEMKLAYDGLKLYILDFLNQDTPIVKESIKSTKNDIVEIIKNEQIKERFTHKD